MRGLVNLSDQFPGRPGVWPLALKERSKPAGMLAVTAPFDLELLANVETAGAQQVQQCLETAYQLFRDRDAWLSLAERIGVLERAARIMLREKNTLAITAAREGGKPLSDCQIEVQQAIEGVRLCIDHLRSDAGAVIPMEGTTASSHRAALTQYEPIGVVVAVSAFGNPLNMVVQQVAAAVAAGCPVIAKPADDTPLSCLSFAAILRQAGLPVEWCQVVVAEDTSAAELLVTDPRVAFFSFVGSQEVGWMLRSKIAPGTRCALEHGGAAPVILMDDADQSLAANSIIKGGFYYSGQVSVSVQRVFVPKAYSREFAIALASLAAGLSVGNPSNLDTQVGPLIRPAEVGRVHAWVNEAVEGGAELLSGGAAIGESMYKPTVLLDPPVDARVSREEIFGPVVCMYSYESIDDAIRIANDLPFASHAAVFTKNLNAALRVFKRLDASAVMVNDHTAFRVNGMPFAGLRQSGLGVGGIPYSIDAMRVNKMLVVHSPEL